MKTEKSILIVDDDLGIRESLSLIFGEKGFTVSTCESKREALEFMEKSFFNAAVVDIKLPDGEGVDLIDPMRQLQPDMPVIIETGYATVDNALKALNQGAAGFIIKPINVDQLLKMVDDAVEMQKLKAEKKQSRDALRQSEERFRALFEDAPLAYQSLDLDGNLVEVNRAWSDITGYSKEETLGRNYADFLHPDYVEELKSKFLKLVKSGKISEAVFVLIKKDGGEIEISLEGRAGYNPDGSFKQIHCIFHYITEKQRMLEALRNSEEKYRGLVVNATSGIFQSTAAGKFIDVNPALVEMLGYDSEIEMLKLDLPRDVYLRSEDRERLLKIIRESGQVKNAESEWKRKDGKIITVHINGRAIKNTQQEIIGYEAIAEDVTELKLLEAKIWETQKNKSLSILAGGVAHDYNNILQAILGNANLALWDIPQDSPAYECVVSISKSAQYAAELTRQMMAFAGPHRFEVRPLHLSGLVEEMKQMLEASISKKISLELSLDRAIPAIEADATQIRQVIMNLVVNASEAIGDDAEGMISIRTGELNCDDEYLRDHLIDDQLKSGRCVFLEVRDNGCGIEKSALGKVFDPFFTTKFTGRGLGLAAVKGIITGHKGVITVENEPGRGTVFRVILPASDKSATNPETEASVRKRRKYQGTAFVVDDVKAVRTTAEKMLKKLGFKVISAENGREAVEIFKQNSSIIDLIILDHKMPVMDGLETLRTIRETDRKIIIILSSGFNMEEAVSKFGSLNLNGFIQKPYDFSVLEDCLRNTLPREMEVLE